MARFKIDINDYSSEYRPFALYQKRTRNSWFVNHSYWEKIENFKTIADAREYYERIKELPEYLD